MAANTPNFCQFTKHRCGRCTLAQSASLCCLCPNLEASAWFGLNNLPTTLVRVETFPTVSTFPNRTVSISFPQTNPAHICHVLGSPSRSASQKLLLILVEPGVFWFRTPEPVERITHLPPFPVPIVRHPISFCFLSPPLTQSLRSSFAQHNALLSHLESLSLGLFVC